MGDWRRREERRREREAEEEAEANRRRDNPTDDEQRLDELDAILNKPDVHPDVEELGRILRWHMTGSKW